MANLELIRQMRRKYDSAYLEKAGTDSNLLESSKGVDFQKAFASSALERLGGDYDQYFFKGLEANVFLLFIDVCNFSTRYESLTGQQISDYFDEYYNIIIPIIYKFNGEVEKIIGDGIIAVFGQPFTDLLPAQYFVNADLCAREIIIRTRQTSFSSKVAFHGGKVKYYKNKSDQYQEYTMIGKPLTELFRLESISEPEGINFFFESNVRRCYGQALSRGSSWMVYPNDQFNDTNSHTWIFKRKRNEPLPGIGNEAFNTFSLELK